MQACGWREGVKLHLAVKVCVQVRMAAVVGPGCGDHSCSLHAGVPRYLQHLHWDLTLGMRLDWCPRGTAGFQSLSQKGFEGGGRRGERERKQIIMLRICNYFLALHLLHHTGS